MSSAHQKRIKLTVTQIKCDQLYERMLRNGIFEEDLEESFVHSGGPGGQKVNKSATSVCIKHKISGIQVKCQKTRSQGLNRYYARKQLCELVEAQNNDKNSIYAKTIAKKQKQKNRRKRRSLKKLSEIKKD